jgi:DNA integrity scanning protein DisA with diadenylate cyclase activity
MSNDNLSEAIVKSSENEVVGEADPFQEYLEALKERLVHLIKMVPSLKHCAHLSHHLQEICGLRERLDQLEQGLLHIHLKCCISPSIRIPGEVVLAVCKLSAKRQGALIVLEQEDNLDEYLQGGVDIDALVSAPILESIFYPGSQLHDGAVFIRENRVEKAACILPYAAASAGLESLGLGTRHQAAIGLSQLSDALIIVVSEEKGWISLALRGKIYPNLGTFTLLKSLGDGLKQKSLQKENMTNDTES